MGAARWRASGAVLRLNANLTAITSPACSSNKCPHRRIPPSVRIIRLSGRWAFFFLKATAACAPMTSIRSTRISENQDWAEACHAYAQAHDQYFTILREADNCLREILLDRGPEADARRAR